MTLLAANKLGALGVLVGDAMRNAVGNVSPTAAAILFTLQHRGAMTASELAGIAGITQPTTVRVANGLVSRGWIERAGRVGKTAPLRLSPAGRREAEAMQGARLAALDRLLGSLSGDERQAFGHLLDRILSGATDSRGFARTTCRLCDHALCDGPGCPIGTRATELDRRGYEQARKG